MSDFLNQWGSYYGPAAADEDTTAGDIATVDSRLGCDEQDIDYDEPCYEDDGDYEDDSDYEDDDDSDYDSEDDYEDDDDDSDYEDEDDYEDDDDESCREDDGYEDEPTNVPYASYEDAYQAGYDAAVHSYENIPDLDETDDPDLDL